MHGDETDDLLDSQLWCSYFYFGRQCFQNAELVFFKETGIVIGISIHSSFFLSKNEQTEM